MSSATESNEKGKRIGDFLLLDPSESFPVLAEAAKQNCTATIWTKNHEISFDTHLTHVSVSDRTFYSFAPKGFDTKQFEAALKKSGIEDCFFRINFPNANLFFQTKYLGAKIEMIFALPSKLYKVERRTELRLFFNKNDKKSVSFEHPQKKGDILTRRCVDLSMTGVGFQASKSEKDLYQIGEKLSVLHLAIDQDAIEGTAEIKHVSPLHGGGPDTLKIGIKFLNLTENNIISVAEYIQKNKK